MYTCTVRGTQVHSELLPRGLGDAAVPYACAAGLANQYFNQGLTQRYAFTDNEAACSFLKAAEV